MISLAGKRAFITGASRGIGRLIALFMARQGCHLILHSRLAGHSEETLDKAKSYGVEARCVEADFSSPSQVQAMLGEIARSYESIDVVFNNAGMQVAYRKNFWQTPVDDFHSSFQVNMVAAAMICYQLIPPMIERGFGRVINLTSGIQSEPEQAGYSASKAALDKYTRDLGSRLNGSNVLINLADPGWCRTDLGGPSAPAEPESSLPGVVIGAFIDDTRSGRLFTATQYAGLSLEQAVAKAEAGLGV